MALQSPSSQRCSRSDWDRQAPRVGKIRHLDVEDLWVQAKVREKVVDLVKVPGSDNPADCLTKYVDRAILTKMLKLLGMRVMEGQSGAAPELPPDPTLTPA